VSKHFHPKRDLLELNKQSLGKSYYHLYSTSRGMLALNLDKEHEHFGPYFKFDLKRH